MLAQLNDCIGGLLHLGPNVITFRTLLHLGQLLHLGLQQTAPLLATLCKDSVKNITMILNHFQRLTLESWFTNLEQTPLNRCQPLPAPYKRLIHDINITNEPNRTT